MENKNRKNIDAYRPTLLIFIFVSVVSSAALDYSKISGAVDGRVKRGLILNSIDKIIHPEKKEKGVVPGSDSFSFEKQLAFHTPLGGFSVSSSVHKKQTNIPLNPQQKIPPIQGLHSIHFNQLTLRHPWQMGAPTDYSYGTLPSYVDNLHEQELGQYAHGAEKRPLLSNITNNPIDNGNKEKDKSELVFGSGVPVNGPHDGKPNEGGTINVSKKDTEKNTLDCENRNKEILESVFGSNPDDKETSGADRINIRSGI